MNRKQLAAFLMAAAALAYGAACAKKDAPLRTRVMVTGDADVRAQPDTAVVVLSVVTQSSQALDAQQVNARKSEAVINAVKGASADSEIKTSDYSLQPEYSYKSSLPKIAGYEARNTVTVTTGALDQVGGVIDEATRAGANSVESVNFVLRESSPARRQTLSEATRQAMEKATSIAIALGGRVVRVVEQQEGGFVNRPPTLDERVGFYEATRANMQSAAKMSPRTPVESGSLNVKSQVQLVVEIETRP